MNQRARQAHGRWDSPLKCLLPLKSSRCWNRWNYRLSKTFSVLATLADAASVSYTRLDETGSSTMGATHMDLAAVEKWKSDLVLQACRTALDLGGSIFSSCVRLLQMQAACCLPQGRPRRLHLCPLFLGLFWSVVKYWEIKVVRENKIVV